MGSGTGEKSFYDVSSFGKNVINGLMSAFMPSQEYEASPWKANALVSSSPQSSVSISLRGLPLESEKQDRFWESDTHLERTRSLTDISKIRFRPRLTEAFEEGFRVGSSIESNPYVGERKQVNTPFIRSK